MFLARQGRALPLSPSRLLSSPSSPPHGFERIKTMEVLGLWSKSQEAHGFGGIWPWVVDVVVSRCIV
uniref:Uncharacterized protein n=1 Tax=Fagus sylvatica TaxID=28930 RepID=A0A2N9GNM2_FAGSY